MHTFLIVISKKDNLTVHETFVEKPQGGILVHDGLLEDATPERLDALRLFFLQQVQNFIKTFPHVVFTLHATHFLHTQKYGENKGLIIQQ